MHVPKLNLVPVLAVSLSLVIGCAPKHHRDQRRSAATPQTAEATERTPIATPASEPTHDLSRAELEAEFEVQQRKIEVAVTRLRREHQVYIDKSWVTKVIQWWPWPKKKDRQAIGDLIEEVEVAAERQAEIARRLSNPDLAVRAEVERERARGLLESLEKYNAHDHNVYQ